MTQEEVKKLINDAVQSDEYLAEMPAVIDKIIQDYEQRDELRQEKEALEKKVRNLQDTNHRLYNMVTGDVRSITGGQDEEGPDEEADTLGERLLQIKEMMKNG